MGAGDRANALRRAILLSELTVGWNTIVGGCAVATASVSSNLALIGFGVNALVDSSVSVILIARFRHERAGRHEHAEQAEANATRAAALAFCAIAAYLTVQAIRSLLDAHQPGQSDFALAEALASIVVLPPLALAKRRTADQLASNALRADSSLTFFGALLALVACLALLLLTELGWWWSDGVAALGIAALLLAESRRVLRD